MIIGALFSIGIVQDKQTVMYLGGIFRTFNPV